MHFPVVPVNQLLNFFDTRLLRSSFLFLQCAQDVKLVSIYPIFHSDS